MVVENVKEMRGMLPGFCHSPRKNVCLSIELHGTNVQAFHAVTHMGFAIRLNPVHVAMFLKVYN